ncbi:MAG: hypothetical protein Ct9H300mP25_09630 [Acidobacteriota bacterium]|nr:MAG: hypothetical protein Ct9H300mP25_09630 [Acidobacteriota bacterium]
MIHPGQASVVGRLLRDLLPLQMVGRISNGPVTTDELHFFCAFIGNSYGVDEAPELPRRAECSGEYFARTWTQMPRVVSSDVNVSGDENDV